MRKMYVRELWREFLQPRFAGWFIVSVGVLGLATFWLGFGEFSAVYSCITTLGAIILLQNRQIWERSETRELLHISESKAQRAPEVHQSIHQVDRKFALSHYILGTVAALLVGVLVSLFAFTHPANYLFAILIIAMLVAGYAYKYRSFWIVALSPLLLLSVIQQAFILEIKGDTALGLRIVISFIALSFTAALACQKQTAENRRPIRIALLFFLLAYVEAWLTAPGSFAANILVGGYSYCAFASAFALFAWNREKRLSFSRDLGMLAAVVLLITLFSLGETSFVAVVMIMISAGLLLAGIGIPSRISRQMSVVFLLITALYYLWLTDQFPAYSVAFPLLHPISFLGDPLFIVLAGGWWLLREYESEKLVKALSPGLLAAAASVFVARWSFALEGISQLAVFVCATSLIAILATKLRIKELSIVATVFAVIVVVNLIITSGNLSTSLQLQLFFLLIAALLITVTAIISLTTKRRYAH